uniref:Axonemal dynein light chain domain containing 1 n=1 Tax=Gadus morhua TaxID=8049 RepID=A0A8C4YUH2_GADMO
QQGVPVPELLSLCVTRRPSSRWEVVKLIQVMDDMMEKTGIHQQTEDLTDISQMGALLELLKVEQNIYNIVFHELIRQVSVNCAERGLLQQYVCLLERVPRQLKGLHAASLAERALNHILTQEVVCFKTCIQHLNTELAEIKTHDESLSQQAEQAQQNLAEALDQATKNADLLREYHELYELQRRRLQSQMETLAEERDLWRADTFSLAAKVISLGKLKQFHRLHVSAESWCKTAQQYATFISIKVHYHTNNTLHYCTILHYNLTTLHRSAKQYSYIVSSNLYCQHTCITLTVQCERYSGEQMLSCQDSLKDLVDLEDSWVEVALCVFRRHPGLDGEPPRGQEAMRKQGRVVSELHQQLETRVNGENGIHKLTMSLVSPMEAWANKMRTAIGQSDTMQASDWLKLEKALFHWQSIADEILQLVSCSQSEYERTQVKLHNLVAWYPKLSLRACVCLCPQQECSDWIETCRVLLLDVKRGPVELSISPPRPSSNYPDSAPNHTDPASDQYDPASHPPNSASLQLPEPDSNLAHPDYKRCCPAPNPPSSFSKPLLGDPELLLSTALSHHSLLCEQRAVTAEEALQGARLRILHLESQLHDKISMEPAGTTRTMEGPAGYWV